jgi:hypothetical protein
LPVRGNAVWTPQRLTWLSLLMSWDEGATLGSRWEHAATTAHATHRHWRLGDSYSGFVEALARESPRLCDSLVNRFRREMQALTACWRCDGWVAFGVDGTRQEAPHTADNEATLGCAGRSKTAPQVYVTVMLHLSSGLPWDFRVGPGTSSERLHAMDMVDALPPGALLVGDAGFPGYELCRKLNDSGRAFLLRVGGNTRLLKQLGYYRKERGGIVYLWPQKRQQAGEAPLVLRLIRIRLGKRIAYLITNVLDGHALPAATAKKLYRLRWSEEVFFRSHKQTLAHRKLLSRTGANCQVESQWLLLGLWLLGLLTVSRIAGSGGQAHAWSVAKSRDLVRQAMRNDRPRRRSKSTRPRASLCDRLAQALKDGYQRRGSKSARNYPRQKNDTPPGPPEIKTAAKAEVKRAARLPPAKIAGNWAA